MSSPPGAGDRDRGRQAAAGRALDEFVEAGMVLGLGSGRTAQVMVRALADRVRAGLRVVGVATSPATRELAGALGIPLCDLNDVGELDLTLDSADELDPAGRMIKGGGGCLLWEKIVARASRRWVAVVDDAKRVETLGRFPLPIEVVPFGWRATARALRRLLAERGHGEVELRLRGGEEAPFVTDGGHYLLDGVLGRIAEPGALAAALTALPGVVESGLFVGYATAAAVGHDDGTAEVLVFPGPASPAGRR